MSLPKIHTRGAVLGSDEKSVFKVEVETESKEAQPKPDSSQSSTDSKGDSQYLTADQSIFLYATSLKVNDYTNSPLIEILNTNAEDLSKKGNSDLFHMGKMLELYYDQFFISTVTGDYAGHVIGTLESFKESLLVGEKKPRPSSNHHNRRNLDLKSWIKMIILASRMGELEWNSGEDMMKFMVHLDALGLLDLRGHFTQAMVDSYPDEAVRLGFAPKYDLLAKEDIW